MPVNSFENYYMSWKPDRHRLSSPVYISLADMMEQDILDNTLPANTKLPPQRELADYLDLNLSTITKAYKLCEMRGLIQARVGQGTFVVPHANASLSVVSTGAKPIIEMAAISPYYSHNETVRDIASELLSKSDSARFFDASATLGTDEQKRIGAEWISRSGLEIPMERTIIASGVQNALAIILSSLFEAGDRIAVDPYTYPNFIGISKLLGIQLQAISSDDEGIDPDELEQACRLQNIKGIYMMPTGCNPTNVRLGSSRREDIAKIIEKYGLIAIEDDNYSALITDKEPPVACEAPENTIYISGLSKPVCTGLRVAYIGAPEKFVKKLEAADINLNLKLSTLSIEIASEIIRRGLDKRIIAEKRNLSVRRNEIFYQYFPSDEKYIETYCQWLKLPETVSGKKCEKDLIQKGISVLGAERFAAGSNYPLNAIRIATCSPETEEELRDALIAVRNYIDTAK